MAVSGQRPKPAHLKVITGDAGHREKAEDLARLEPTPDGDVVKPKLARGPSIVWDQYAALCIRLGTLTALDVDIFAQWCEVAWFLRKCKSAERTAALLAQHRVMGGTFGMGANERARIGLNLGKHAADGKPQTEKAAAAGGSRYFKD